MPRDDSPNIIIDTDLGNDIDDVLALSNLFSGADRNGYDVRAVVTSKNDPNSPKFAEFYSRYYGIECDVGTYHPDCPSNNKSNYLHLLGLFAERYPELFACETKISDPFDVLNRTLESSEDLSVQMIMIGFSTNVARFLEADDRKDLFNQKVKRIIIMAGNFEREKPEYNVFSDVSSSQRVLSDFTGEIVFFGAELGRKIRFSEEHIQSLHKRGQSYPMIMAYYAFRPHLYVREAWDLLAVAYLDHTMRELYNLEERGVVDIDASGATRFHRSNEGKHIVARIGTSKADRIRSRLSELLEHS